MVAIPSEIKAMVLSHRRKLNPVDPGICIVYDAGGLIQHAPNFDADAGMNEIKNAVIDAGMVAAEEGESTALFTGAIGNAMLALDAIFALDWVRHDPTMDDVGVLYLVSPKGANNVEYSPLRHIFGAH